MTNNRTAITGVLRWQVIDKDGVVKCTGENHNIVTNEGDAMIADLMSETPARTKVNNANGHIQVGTAYSATTPKVREGVVTISGSAKALSATYPLRKGAFGATDDNVVQYRSLFAAGDLTATVNEAAIVNHATPASADCLAYAQIDPAAVVAVTDSLQVDWEITILGA